jgi:Transglycosylase SLT domain
MLTLFGQRVRSTLAVAVFAGVVFAVSGAPAAAEIHDGTMIARYAGALGNANAGLSAAARRDLAERVILLSSYYRIDPCLLGALVTVESSWHARAISPSGALGYGQLMPATAATLDVDALEPYENLDGTARYLRRMLNRFSGSDTQTRMALALASYNAGPAAVLRYHGIPPFRETRDYVMTVLHLREEFLASIETGAGEVIAHVRHFTHVTQTALRRLPKPRTARIAAAPWHPRYSPYLDAPDPNGVPLETPAPTVTHFEPSHSFVARLFGIRRRVVTTTVATTPEPGP